jgi:hypothetical protein
LKVSDEFTVPLCRGHHRALHQVGNEAAWWDDLDINALEIARGLWEETHPQLAPINPAPGSAAAAQPDNTFGETEIKGATAVESPTEVGAPALDPQPSQS